LVLNKDQFMEVFANKLIAMGNIKKISRDKKEFQINFTNNDNSSCEMYLHNFYTNYKRFIENGASPQAALDNILETTQNTFVRDIKGLFVSEFKNIKDRVYPYVRPADNSAMFLARTIYQPLTTDLNIYYVRDMDDSVSFIGKKMLGDWGISKKELIDQAMMNFFRDKDLPLDETIMDNGMTYYSFSTGDSYDATRILLTHRLQEVAKKIKGTALIGVPFRELLLVFNDKPRSFRNFMIYFVHHEHDTREYSISKNIFTLNNGEITRYHID